MSLYATVPGWIKETPGHLKTQGIHKKAVDENPWFQQFIPDKYKTQEMCKRAV